MAKTTGARLFAEMMRDYEVSHIFFVPAFMLKAFAEMEDMPIAQPAGNFSSQSIGTLQRQENPPKPATGLLDEQGVV